MLHLWQQDFLAYEKDFLLRSKGSHTTPYSRLLMRALEDIGCFPGMEVEIPTFVCNIYKKLVISVSDVSIRTISSLTERDACVEGCLVNTEPCDHARHSCAEAGCAGQSRVATLQDRFFSLGMSSEDRVVTVLYDVCTTEVSSIIGDDSAENLTGEIISLGVALGNKTPQIDGGEVFDSGFFEDRVRRMQVLCDRYFSRPT